MRTPMLTRRGGDMGGKSIISNSYLEDIGDAIRYKKSTSETFYPSQMGDAIRSIEGIVPVGSIEIDTNGVYDVTEKAEVDVDVNPDLRPLSVNENGTYEPDGFDGYSDVTVDVEPNLTSLNVTENGLYLPESGVDGFDRVLVNIPVGLVLIDTIEANGVNGVRTDIDMSWFDDYDYIIMVPDLTLSRNDYPYIAQDSTTGGSYAMAMPSIGIQQSLFLGMTGSKLWGSWFRDPQLRPQPYEAVSYLYWYLYSASNTMTGTIKIYGIKISA